jgi:hypothetical protein
LPLPAKHRRDLVNAQHSNSLRRLVAFAHAGYFLITGIWPLLHIRSFEWVSGPKVDRWLVKTVSGLITVIGAVVGLAAWRRPITPEIEALAIGSGLSLAAVDIYYVARRRIRWVYLLDAAAEIALAAAWLTAKGQRDRPGRRSSPATQDEADRT